MEREKKEEALQKEIDRYRSERTKLETERKMKQDRMVCTQRKFHYCCIDSPSAYCGVKMFLVLSVLDQENSFLVCRFIFGMSRSVLYIRAACISRSLGKGQDTGAKKCLSVSRSWVACFQLKDSHV